MPQQFYLGQRWQWSDTTNPAIYIDNEADVKAIVIDEYIAQTTPSFLIRNNAGDTLFSILSGVVTAASSVTTTAAQTITVNSLTTGKGLSVESSATAITGAGRLFRVVHSGATGTSATLSEFSSAATDETIVLQVTASAALAGGTLLALSAAAMTTGTALSITGAVATTTGSLISVNDNSADTGTRSVVSIVQDHASATGATALFIQADNPTIAAVKITGACTIGIDFTGLGATDFLWNCTAASGCTAAPQTNAAIGFITIKVAGTQQWIPYYNAT